MFKTREVAQRAGADRVVWFVWKKNPSALDFYSNLGAGLHDANHLMAWPI
jgi:hypothetical protein